MTDTPDSTTVPESRTDLEALIEAAIARLDEIDPDPDLENGTDGEPDNDGEPLLGAPEARTGSWSGLFLEAYSDEDRELDCADDEDNGDAEPSLGSLDRIADQTAWAGGGRCDLEEQCEDEGAQCDDEGVIDNEDWKDFGLPCLPEMVTQGCARKAVQS